MTGTPLPLPLRKILHEVAAERGKAVLGHGARLGDKDFCPSRVDALAVLDLPKVLQEPAVLRAGASAPSPHLFPPSDGEGTSEMTLNYGGDSNGDSNGVTAMISLQGQQLNFKGNNYSYYWLFGMVIWHGLL